MKKLFSSFFILLLVSLLGINTSVYAAGDSGQEDTTPPVLKSISLESDKTNPADLNVTTGEKIIVTATITDDVSGVTYASASFRNSAGNYISMSLNNKGNDVWTGYTIISQYEKQGEYTLNSFTVEDAAKNRTSTIPSGVTKVKFTVKDTAVDTTAPVIKSITIDRTEATASGEINVTAVVEEDISGVRNDSYSNYVKFHNRDMSRTITCYLRNSGQQSTGTVTLSGKATLDRYTRLGEYKINSVKVYDVARNATSLIPENSKDLKFNVKAGDDFFNDNTAPSINSIVLSTSRITAPGVVTIEAEADDIAGEGEDDEATGKGSGIYSFTFSFYNATTKDRYIGTVDSTNLKKDENTGKYTGTVTFGQWARPNDYKIDSVTLRDNADNTCSIIPEAFTNLLIEVFNGGSGETYQHKTNTDNLSEVIKNEVNPGDKLLVNYTDNDTVTEDVFDSIKGTDTSITFESWGVQWIFNGQDIKEDNIKDIHLSVSVNTLDKFAEDHTVMDDIKKFSQNSPVVVISFPENGELPGTATINIKTDYILREYLGKEEGLYIYYFDRKRQKMVLITEDVKIKEDQYFNFDIEHCSDYILSPVALPEKVGPDTPSELGWSGTEKTVAGWKAVEDASGYDVELRVDHGTKHETVSKNTTSTSLEMKELIDETADTLGSRADVTGVSFRVRSKSAEGEGFDSDWSDYVPTEYRPPLIPLKVPDGLSWTGTEKTTASWNAVQYADSYKVELKVSCGADSKIKKTTTSNAYMELYPLIDELFREIGNNDAITGVSFRVCAVSATPGKHPESDFSEYSADSGYRWGTLEVPHTLSWNGVNKTTANWSAVKDADTYHVELRVNYGSRYKIAERKVSGTSYDMKELIDRIFTQIGDSETVTGVRFRVYADSKDTQKYPRSEFSDYSEDSGLRPSKGSGEGGTDTPETETETVLAVKGTVEFNPGFEVKKWKSSSGSVASVSSKGKVTGKKAGTAVITAIEKGGSSREKTYKVKVEKPVLKKETLLKNDPFDLEDKIVTDKDARLIPVGFTSSKEDVIRIDDTGYLTPLKSGKSKITVLYKHGSISTTYTVKLPGIKEERVNLLESKTKKLTLTNKNKKLSISFNSADPFIATVSEKGAVKAVNPGVVKISLYVDGVPYDTCEITVKTPAIGQSSVNLRQKKTVQLKIQNKSKNIVYTSDKPEIATVTKGGKVKGVSAGKATITLSINGVAYDTCEVNVT